MRACGCESLHFMHVIRKVILLAAVARAASAQATVHIDPLDPVYSDVRVLIGAGLVDRVVVGQLPYSRLELAGIVRQAAIRLARSRAAENGPRLVRDKEARFLSDLLESIRNRFDLDSIGGDSVRAHLSPTNHLLRSIGGDLTHVRSPTRVVPRDNGLGSIDAVVNPILANREGRPLSDGSNFLVGSLHHFESSWIAIGAQPELQSSVTHAGTTSIRGTLQEAELRVLYRNFALDLGRAPVRWGQALTGSLMTSANSPPLNQLRISNEQLLTLPWLLHYLGPAKFSLFYSDLGDEQNFPGAYFVGYKASIAPGSRLELGASVYSKSGGHGAPAGSFTARLLDLFPFLDASNYANKVGLRGVFEFSDRYAGMDGRLRFPGARGLEMYGEVLLNDFDVRRLGSVFWEDAGHVFGVSVPRLSTDGRLSGSLEYHHTGNRYYEHFQYLSGQTLQRMLIGDPLGPDAQGAYAQLGWYRTSARRLTLELAAERRSNDQYMYWPVALPKFGWSRIQDRPKEWRGRALVSWRSMPSKRPLGAFVQAGYERVQNFNFLDGDNRNNLLARVGMEYRTR